MPNEEMPPPQLEAGGRGAGLLTEGRALTWLAPQDHPIRRVKVLADEALASFPLAPLIPIFMVMAFPFSVLCGPEA